MDGFLTLLVTLGPWLVLGLLASGHGTDSRDTMPDDHRR
jgi:hypothetical protein